MSEPYEIHSDGRADGPLLVQRPGGTARLAPLLPPAAATLKFAPQPPAPKVGGGRASSRAVSSRAGSAFSLKRWGGGGPSTDVRYGRQVEFTGFGSARTR